MKLTVEKWDGMYRFKVIDDSGEVLMDRNFSDPQKGLDKMLNDSVYAFGPNITEVLFIGDDNV